MAIAETPAYVQERAEDYALVERETGAVLSTHDTLRRALDAALGLEAFGAKLDHTLRAVRPVLHDHDSGAACGAYRWLDASAEEAEEMDDGSQVTPGAIRSMAARLNDGEAVPLDGGAIPGLAHSEVHGQLRDSGVLARGWAHVGVEWREEATSAWPDGRVHLALYAEVLPDVARAMDTGELAFGSIGFAQSPKNHDDAVLVQHALTNRPAVPGLLPAPAMRTEVISNGRRFARGPIRRMHMTIKNTAARGPASEKLKSIFASLNITGDDALKNFYECVYNPLRALQDAATVEGMLEGATAETTVALSQDGAARAATVVALGARMVAANAEITMVSGRATITTELDKRITAFAKDLGVDAAIVKAAVMKAIAAQMGAGDAPAEEAEKAKPAAEPMEKIKGDEEKPEDKPVGKSADAVAPRAIPGLESPEALEAFAADCLAVLRAIFGDEAMPPPAALDALKAAQDGIKGMLAGGAGTPPEGAPGDMPAGRSADFVSMRTELTALRARSAANATTIAMLQAEAEKAKLTVEVARAFTNGGRVSNEKAVAETVEMIVGTNAALRGRVLEMAVRAAPPAGEAMPDAARDTTPGDGAFATLEDACVHYRSAIKLEAPALGEMEVRTAALRRARENHPRLA